MGGLIMSKKLNLSGKLDFTDIDLTAPEVVINELLEELPAETNGLICGKIQSYSGHVMSYKTRGISSLALALETTSDRDVDIQNDLGKMGTEIHKFECYLYTPEYESYRYRMFFVKYNVSNYPVTVVLEESIAKSISGTSGEYIYTCDTRNELEELVVNVLTSKRIITVMQELIRVNQSKRNLEKTTETTTDEENG